MFTHEKLKDHFDLEILSNGAGTLLEVVPERGGIISRFEVNGKEVFYMDRDTLNDTTKNVRGGNPILFPICGPVAGGTYQIDGNEYAMKQHGFARNLAWHVISTTTSDDEATLAIRLTSDAITKAQYPFDFVVDFTYRLTADALRIDQRYENRSDHPMPFYAGFHPYFAAPDKSAVSIKLSAENFDDFIAKELREPANLVNFDAAPETNGAYQNVTGGSAEFSNFQQHQAIEISFGEPYQHVVIWALKDKPFICVEPWMGLNNSMKTGVSVTHLAPGAHLETFVTFKVK